MNNTFTLADNSKIAVIGGGPSGSFFSIFALKMAKMLDRKIDVTIFEPKDFTKDGPIGCNRCGGVISEHLVQTLAIEGINIPPDVVQRGINSYVLHTQKGDVVIESPSHEKRIATVYRGGGPKGIKEKEKNSFDDFLLKCAIREGAVHVPSRIDGIKYKEKPVLSSGSRDVMEADLVVGAFGVNSSTYKLFDDLNIGYKGPATTSAYIAEIELGRETVSRNFGNSIHFFLLPYPRNIKFAALIPKGNYATLCVLGSGINQETVTALLNTPVARKVLPHNIMSDRFCICFPKLSIDCAEGGFSDRIVFIGDAGSTRLFKDGIGASYMMGKAAAKTAVFHGVSKAHFTEHYLPVYKRMNTDNMFGRFIYMTTTAYKNYSLLTESMVSVVRKEQQEKADKFRRLSSILWDTFTGNETYKNIFMRGTNIMMHVKLIREFIKALIRRI